MQAVALFGDFKVAEGVVEAGIESGVRHFEEGCELGWFRQYKTLYATEECWV